MKSRPFRNEKDNSITQMTLSRLGIRAKKIVAKYCDGVAKDDILGWYLNRNPIHLHPLNMYEHHLIP